MHEIENQAIGRAARSGRALWPCALLLAVCLPLTCGCRGAVTTPSVVAPMSLAGTWRGGTTTESRVWRLTQVGERVSGSSSVVGSSWTGEDGRVVGTLSGSSFGFSESYPVGSLSMPGCSTELGGVLRVDWKTPDTAAGIPPTAVPPSGRRLSMSGFVQGRGCDGSFSSVVTLYRD